MNLAGRSSFAACAASLCWLFGAFNAAAQTPAVAADPAAYTAYLMAYFGPQEKLFYATSRDARRWTALNDNKPVFDPGNGVRLRDPFLNRVGGVFHLVHTKAWDTPIIYHWTSSDLLHWDGGPHTVVNPEQKRAWAPEFYFSAEENLFYVFWASLINDHCAIFYTTTRDWKDLTPARSSVYFDTGRSDIDFTVTEYGGIYYAFHKVGMADEMLGNRLSTSRSLDPHRPEFDFARTGFGEAVLPGPTNPTEGPEIIRLIGENRWYVYVDPFHAPMEAWETTDFKTFGKIPVEVPPGAKHCGLLPITEAELQRLTSAYPNPSPGVTPSPTR